MLQDLLSHRESVRLTFALCKIAQISRIRRYCSLWYHRYVAGMDSIVWPVDRSESQHTAVDIEMHQKQLNAI